jgi:hypothetical protein
MWRASCVFLVACSSTVIPLEGGPDGGDEAPADAYLPPRTFALRKMFAGDADRTFKANATAWRSYGEDLDKDATTESSAGTCRLAAGAASSVRADGDAGIDNSFGANVLPLLVANGFAIPSLQWSESSQQGAARAVLVRLAAPSASVRVGALLPMAPDFNSGMGAWAVSSLFTSELVFQTDFGEAHGQSITDALPLFIPYDKGVLVLRLHHFSFRGTPSANGKTLDTGTLAGILDPNELVEAARQAIGGTKPAMCTAFDAIAASIRLAPDILSDGSSNPMADCDGISIGLGFEGAAIDFGPVTNDPGPSKPCP